MAGMERAGAACVEPGGGGSPAAPSGGSRTHPELLLNGHEQLGLLEGIEAEVPAQLGRLLQRGTLERGHVVGELAVAIDRSRNQTKCARCWRV